MWKSVLGCGGVLGEVWNVEKVRGKMWGSVGRGEGECMGVNVRSVAKCVRVWGEAWWVWGKMWESVLGCGVR